MNETIHILVRGVIIIDDHVLLAHAKDAANTFLRAATLKLARAWRTRSAASWPRNSVAPVTSPTTSVWSSTNGVPANTGNMN